MITLQDKYSTTGSSSLPPTRVEKSHFVSCSDSAGSSSCTTPSTTTNVKISNTVKKVSHHTSPPTTKELAYLDHGKGIKYQVATSTPSRNKTENQTCKVGETGYKIRHNISDALNSPSDAGCNREEIGKTSQYKDAALLGLTQQPKMRVVHPPRGAHHMYSTASSSSSSLASSVTEPHRGSTSAYTRKRNYNIIFDENDEDTLI